MDSIKAQIQGEGVDSSVEFSVEEVLAQHHGKPWDEMSPEEQDAELKDYALSLFSRQNGMMGDFRVSLGGGSFSKVGPRDI